MAPTFPLAHPALVDDLQNQSYAWAPGDVMGAWLQASAGCWLEFKSFWTRLTLDQHMGDGGRYRLRRYGRCLCNRATGLHTLPHGPYQQSLAVNPLNGGVNRHFDPLEPEFLAHPLLHNLLFGLVSTLDALKTSPATWRVDLHPYRILALGDTPGKPSPEGLHRDGVDYIVSLLVHRQNVEGGATTLCDPQGRPLTRRTLLEPMDLVLADDLACRHDVSPVQAIDPSRPGFRDVLVLAFTRQ